jgi:hypothetical protein
VRIENVRAAADQEKPDDDLISRAFLASVGQDIPFEVIRHSTGLRGRPLLPIVSRMAAPFWPATPSTSSRQPADLE